MTHEDQGMCKSHADPC